MNLIKSFNKNYCIQNLKKSKGSLITFLALLPLFTSFMIIVIGLNSEGYIVQTLEFELLSIINIMGMYVIPIIISYCLFGFVFKKKSVDFVNSLPMSRKTVFITNTITGIALILLEQFITILLILLATTIFPNIIIPISQIIDMFLIFTITYIFMFTTTNLAMTVSGNFLTQIVVTMLILFLIPFCSTVISEFSFNKTLVLEGLTQEKITLNANTVPEYVLPYNIIMYVFNGESIYTTATFVKMIIYSIIYLIIGMKLFEIRKMENSENSFANSHIHGFVKGLTLFPLVSILYYFKSELSAVIILGLIIVAYFFIYDIVTGKKVKLKYNIGYLTLAIIGIFCFNWCTGIYNESELSKKKINIEDIKAGYIFAYDTSSVVRYSHQTIYNDTNKIEIDENLIKRIFDNSSDKASNFIAMEIKLKNGETYVIETRIDDDELSDVKNKIYMEQNQKNEDIFENCIELSVDRLKLTNEEQKQLRELLKEEANINNLKSDGNIKIYLYYYQKLNVRTKIIYIGESEKLRQFYNEITRKNLKEILEKENDEYYYSVNICGGTKGALKKFNIYNQNSINIMKETASYSNASELYDITYSSNATSLSFANRIESKKFLLDDLSKQFDSTKDYLILRVYVKGISINYFTNSIDEVKKYVKENNIVYNYSY